MGGRALNDTAALSLPVSLSFSTEGSKREESQSESSREGEKADWHMNEMRPQ